MMMLEIPASCNSVKRWEKKFSFPTASTEESLYVLRNGDLLDLESQFVFNLSF